MEKLLSYTVLKDNTGYADMTIYVVKQGDTLEGIADTFGVSTEELIADNGITNAANLVVGQSIIILPPDAPEENLGVLYVNGYAYPFIDREVLRLTLPNFTYFTLFTYGFTPEGNLVVPDDTEVIPIIREYGVAPLMLISTLTEEGTFNNQLSNAIFADPEAQERLITNVLNTMKEKNYYGLDIDFEFILPEDREGYVAFVRNITGRLNAEGYEVMVALAPKTSADQPGLLYEGHDYEALGAAANWVLLMTYEWGYTYGPPMAVAPVPKVREVLDYAVTVIPREKIFMGMPNYGYDWTLPFVSGESRAQSLGNVQAVERAAEFGAVIQYDEDAQAPFYNYFDATGREHVVWFEDARSVEAKVRLAAEYNFRGISYWNLMKAFPQSWTIVNNLFTVAKIPEV